ncbi:MAG: retroviral-like aspartic protease family protein [Defluviitaleaceae bacterium]|nr:retroviral-like aspartic protease family protein [Defluviitaleaceae bacterium]
MFNEPIPISPEGRGIIDVFLKPLNEVILEPKDFKLDTGADITTISKETLNELGYDNDWITANAITDPNRTMQSAGVEKKSATYVILPAVNFFGRDLVNWPLHILADDDKDYPNLIGLDILRYFVVTFDFAKWELILIPIDEPKKTNIILENQRIYTVNTAGE